MADPANTGIYEIVNLVNGKRYIGSAKSLKNRRSQHWTRLKGGWHHNRKLQRSWNKYGAESFQFRVLLCCRVIDLLLFEQRAIDAIRPELNICPTAGSTLGRVHSKETRTLIALSKVGLKMAPRSVEHREALSRANKGKPKDPAHLEKLLSGRRKYVRTEEDCKAVSLAMKRAYEDGRHRRDRPTEYRDKISKTLTGRKLSDEHRANVSRAMTGKKRGPYKLDPAKAEKRSADSRAAAFKANQVRWGNKPPT